LKRKNLPVQQARPVRNDRKQTQQKMREKQKGRTKTIRYELTINDTRFWNTGMDGGGMSEEKETDEKRKKQSKRKETVPKAQAWQSTARGKPRQIRKEKQGRE
jgi:hypothetical protein